MFSYWWCIAIYLNITLHHQFIFKIRSIIVTCIAQKAAFQFIKVLKNFTKMEMVSWTIQNMALNVCFFNFWIVLTFVPIICIVEQLLLDKVWYENKRIQMMLQAAWCSYNPSWHGFFSANPWHGFSSANHGKDIILFYLLNIQDMALQSNQK